MSHSVWIRQPIRPCCAILWKCFKSIVRLKNVLRRRGGISRIITNIIIIPSSRHHFCNFLVTFNFYFLHLFQVHCPIQPWVQLTPLCFSDQGITLASIKLLLDWVIEIACTQIKSEFCEFKIIIHPCQEGVYFFKTTLHDCWTHTLTHKGTGFPMLAFFADTQFS